MLIIIAKTYFQRQAKNIFIVLLERHFIGDSNFRWIDFLGISGTLRICMALYFRKNIFNKLQYWHTDILPFP